MKKKFTVQAFSGIKYLAVFVLINALFLSKADATSTFIVNNTADTDDGTALTPFTLRKCIRLANITANTPGVNDVISFSGLGSGTYTIALSSDLPSPTEPVTIDGYTAVSYTGNNPQIILDGNVWGILFNNAVAAGSIIQGISFIGSNHGLEINGVNNITVKGCWFGISSTGAAQASPAILNYAIHCINSDGNTIGGPNAADRNIIGGVQIAVFLEAGSDNNNIAGNYIGLNSAGTAAIANSSHGIHINTNCLNNTIGGATVNHRNVIAASAFHGIYIIAGSNNTLIKANYIGLNAAGTSIISNQQNGIAIDNCTGSIIGGATAAERNVIAGAGLPNGGFSGISLSNNSNSTQISGNYIGFLADGISAAGNSQHGIWSLNSTTITITNNVIGNNGYGTNDGSGIFLGNSATVATLQGNIIGLDKNGTQRRGNKIYGIDLSNADNTQVGGTTTALRNVISGNDSHGVFVEAGSSGVVFEGNFIGTDINGTGTSGALGNGTTGILLDGASINCRIGGTSYNQRNIISGNGRLFVYGVSDGSGVKVLGASTGLVFKGNFVGLEKNGTTALPNAEMGLSVEGASNNAVIGGSTAPERNVVSAHGYHGIQFRDGDNADISGNYIGTDSTGLISRGNNASGIILIFATNVTIGKALSGTGNVISNNHEMGIHIIGGNTITIYNNLIGVASNGTSAMGNFDGGIRVFGVGGGVWNGRAVVIGGTAALQANTIAYSTGGNGSTAFGDGYGVGIIHNDYGRFNPVVGNKIYCNATKGIELGAGSTFTGSPSIGASTQAGNIGKAAPVITTRSTTSISGSAANGDAIHVYKNTTIGTGCGCEGEIYLGTTTAGGGGTWSFTFAPALTAAEVTYVTVTATDANNNTSEFNCNIAALPVRLISFTVTAAEDNSALASWETSNEEGNKYFVLERSLDGSNFEPIGTFNGSGNSGAINFYSFSDSDHPSGILYYRLKQVDTDGSFTYSAVRSIYFEDKKYITIGPNPTDDKVNVMFSGYSEKDHVKITIISPLGEMVASYDHFLNSNSVSFDLAGLPSAVYFVTISTGDNKINKKLVVE
jgi:hypothetical protein